MILIHWFGNVVSFVVICLPFGHDWYNGGERCADCYWPRPEGYGR